MIGYFGISWLKRNQSSFLDNIHRGICEVGCDVDALELCVLVVTLRPAGQFRMVLGQRDETTFKTVSAARRGETASQLFWADSSFRM